MPHFNSTKILGDLKVTGLTDLYEVGSFTLKGQLNSSLPNGTAPFVITSSTLVNNLNVQYLNGLDGAHYLSWTNTTNKPSPVITLGGDLSGSVTLTSLGNGTLNATINANSVALGTDTTGNYVATIGSITNGGLTINNSGSENAAVTIGHSNIITAGTRSGSSGAIGFGGTISIPSITYDVNGHIVSTTTTSVTLPTPVYPPEADTLATVTSRGNTTTNTIATARQTITQNMISGTTAAFTNPHLKLAAGDTVDTTGFVGMTFATSTSDNYGFSVGALRSTNGDGSFVIRNHNSSPSGTEIFRLDSAGNLTVPGKMYVEETIVSSTSNGILFEGSVADDFEGLLKAGTLTADRTYTLPDATGTIALTNNLLSTATDDILDGTISGTTITYAPYSTNLSATGNRLYTHATVPTATSRLNLSSYFWATRLHSLGIYGGDLSGGNLTIGSTSHSTKGTINLDSNTRVNGSTTVIGNIILDGTPTEANQARTIHFTGFDKETVGDSSDIAYIRHTVNLGGHTGSVLELASQNDAADGIAFTTHASSHLRHNGDIIWDAGNSNLSTVDWNAANLSLTGSVSYNDVSRYWLNTSTNWGLYWDTTDNRIEFHGAGTDRAGIDLDTGEASFNGTVTSLTAVTTPVLNIETWTILKDASTNALKFIF